MRSCSVLFENLVQFAPDALIVVDSAGRIVFANAMAESVFGFSHEELANLPIETLVPGRLRHSHDQHRHDYAREPRTREMGGSSAELFGARSDGSEFPVEIRLSPIEVSGEMLIAAAVRDVTDRWNTAQTLRAARKEAEGANAVKGRFLAAASHDLRQPLQTLQLLTGALQTQEQAQHPVMQELLTEQHDALGVMSGLLNALLDISKLEAGNIKPEIENISLIELFDELRREFTSTAAAQELQLFVETGPYCIRTDRTLFRQLLENLLANAIQYTQTGSITLRCEPQAQNLLVTVVDTGIGIAREQLASIFDEFYQIDRKAHKGVGLGLAIVKRLVSLLGLAIEVRSEPGRGSEFRVTVPEVRIADTALVPRIRAASAGRSQSTSGALILLVEDDRAVRHATEFYLKAVGYLTIGADSIAGAQQALQVAGREPDLIISDYHLGRDETGIELIQRIRSQVGRPLPALLLSGDTSTAVHELTGAYACELLSKPVDVTVLNQAITTLLCHHSTI